jgi:RND superfamily putative drug exporter
VVALSLIILIVVFRSIVVPALATLGFVLSLFAALGVVTAVYQWGWASSFFDVHDPAPLLAFLPILLTGILFGLAMDYQLFITTGMREAYVHGLSARRSVVAGVRHGRAVVTAAAIIMASVFGGFVFSELGMVRPIGLGLAMGVLLDAFVVRMVLVPSIMDLFGEKAWWLPRWLDRLLPNVDVEGARLERAHPVGPAAHGPEA